MTDEERLELKQTAKAWKENAKMFTELSQTCQESLKFSYTNIAKTFEIHSKIVGSLAK